MSRSRSLSLKRELEWRKAKADPQFFLEQFFMISHPAHGRIPFKLTEAQREGLRHWVLNRYSLTLKARQIGWSTLAAGYVVWLAVTRPHQNIILLSRTERESILLLRKAKSGFNSLPDWVKGRSPRLVDDHMLRMSFTNESQIVSMPSASDPARGESATLIVVDEWAFLPNPEEAWASIEPVADVGGSVIGLSTANGSGNFFHKLWVGSQTGTNSFVGMFHPWWAAASRVLEDGSPDWSWYEGKKRAMDSWQLAQEYPSSAEEAFIKSGNPVFDLEALDRMAVGVSAGSARVFHRLGQVGSVTGAV